MLDTMPPSTAAFATALQSRVLSSSPFLHDATGTWVLLAPDTAIPPEEQCRALDHLVSCGVLTEYRYIDSKPQPAILAIRA